MLELFPELVRMDEAEAVDPPTESLPLTDYDGLGDNRAGWALTAADMADLTETGTLGDPTGATAAKGREMADEADNCADDEADDRTDGNDAPGGGASDREPWCVIPHV